MGTSFGERLRQARKMRGLSLDGLKAAAGDVVTKNALSKYEHDKMKPGSTVLLSLCRALDLRPDYFYQKRPVTLSGIEFRKRSKLGVKARESIEEQAREYFERYLEIERTLEIESPGLPTFDLTGVDVVALGEEAEQVAVRVREKWQLGQCPLPNIHEMLEDRGVKVMEAEADKDFDGFSGWTDGIPVIVLSKSLNNDLCRKRFTELHELGHLVMRLPDFLAKKAEENVCMRFAGAFLFPRERFCEEFGRNRSLGGISQAELLALKAEWGMSIAAIMFRAFDLGLLPASQRDRFWKKYNRAGYREDEPGEWLGSESSKRFSHLVHRAAAQELITRSKAAGLLGVTLREFDQQFDMAG